MIRHLGVLLAVALADAVWALYIRSVSGRRPLLAGAASVVILLCGAAVTIAYVHDPRYMASAALGAFLGTWLTVRHSA